MASEGPVTTYERERQARIAANRARMELIGVGTVSHGRAYGPQSPWLCACSDFKLPRQACSSAVASNRL